MDVDQLFDKTNRVPKLLCSTPLCKTKISAKKASPLYIFSGYGGTVSRLSNPISIGTATQPSNPGPRAGLLKIFDQNHVTQITDITPKEIINRKMNLIFFYQNTLKTKENFIQDVKIRNYFGTKDEVLLGQFYEIINQIKNGDELSKYAKLDAVIADPDADFIKGAKLQTIHGEAVQKMFYCILGREMGSIEIMNYLTAETKLPSTAFLNVITNNGDPITDIIFSIPLDHKQKIISKMKDEGHVFSNNAVDSVDDAFLNAMEIFRIHSIDINTLANGNDRLTLVVPPKKLQEFDGDDFSKITNYFLDRLTEKSFLNTIDEYKYGSIRPYKTKELLGKGRNKELLVGEIHEYPSIIRTTTDRRQYSDGIGLSRIDRLGRDWKKLSDFIGGGVPFHSTDVVSSDNAKNSATDEFKLTIAKNNFGISDLSSLTNEQKEIVDRIITGYVKKMENSIAQHQMIEFMRSGRWPEPKKLGLDFAQYDALDDAVSNGLLSFKRYRDLETASINTQLSDLSTIIQLPLRDANGNQYNAIIDKDTFFDYQTFTTLEGNEEIWFGITKYLDDTGTVRQFGNLELFAIKLVKGEETIFSKIPTDNVNGLRRLQEEIYNKVFSSINQGHESNFLFEHWMPEINILTVSYMSERNVTDMLKSWDTDYPITYNFYRVFDISIMKISLGGKASYEEFMKIINIVDPKDSNIIYLTKPKTNGDIFKFVKVDDKYDPKPITRNRDQADYTNAFHPIRNIISAKQLLNLIANEPHSSKIFVNNNVINSAYASSLDTDEILEWFGKLPLAHRSSQNARLPSPLGVNTVDPFNANDVPLGLFEIVKGTKDGKETSLLPFRPPIPNLDVDILNQNKQLTRDTTKRMLDKLEEMERLEEYLGTYFSHLKIYLDDVSINKLTEIHNSAEIALIEELKKLSRGEKNLIEFRFKDKFEYLKDVFIWFSPLHGNGPSKTIFTVQDLRLTPGHFPMYPGNVDPDFGGTSFYGGIVYSKENYLIYKSLQDYYQKVFVWLETHVRRILHHLTLDRDMFKQNYEMFLQTQTGVGKTTTMKHLFGKKHVFELAKRYLAPGTTIVFDPHIGKIMLKKTLNDRVFRSGAYLTPIFLDPKIFQNNKEIYRNIINDLGIEDIINVDGTIEPVMKHREAYERFIQAIHNIKTSKEMESLFSAITATFRTIKIIFQKI